jgi:protein-disulfide isomerase
MSALLHRPRLTVPIGASDHTIGPPGAALQLVEYGDFECPYCGAAHPEVAKLLRIVGDDLLFAFRHFPLTQIHPHAGLAAEAAEAAGAQGDFWGMHDLLFENQRRLGLDDLLSYAQALDLDLPRFALELESHAHQPKVREDFLTGVRSGVNGTPTFFVNGIRHNGGYDAASLIAALRAASRSAISDR